MKFFVGLLLVLIQLFSVVADFPVEDGVLVLGEDNFQDAIEAHQNILVEFYAPWCGHCKQLAPEYAKAAKSLADSPVKLAKVDATEHNGLAKQFEVRGFPTLKFFKNGKASDYNGGRTEADIVQWLSKKIGPPATEVKSEEDLAKLQDTHDVFVLGVFSASDSDNAKRFVTLAGQDDGHIFAITTAAEVKGKLGVEADSVIVLKSFDDLRSDLTISADVTDEQILDFVNGNSQPLIQEFSQQTAQKIFSSKITKHVLFFTDKSAGHHQTVTETYKEVAQQFKGKLLFVNVPTSEKKVLDFFDIKETDAPQTILADLGSESGIKKYKYSGDHSAASTAAFFGDFFAGNLKPFLKSEQPDEDDTTGDVVVLRGTTFQDIVMNNSNDVLVEFYAPWCGHCKNLGKNYY